MRFMKRLHEQAEGRRFARAPHHEHGPHGHRFGRGGRLARFLEHGDLRLLVLYLIQEKPRHGYEIIKAIEDLAGGAYAPSPGVIYPTLTMLEELGQVAATADGTRRSYAILPAGAEALAAEQAALSGLLARLAAAQPRETAAPVIRAMENLRTALRLKFQARETAAELTRKVADLLDEAARRIEEL